MLRKNVNFSVRQLKVPDVSGTFTIIDDDGEEEEAENQRIHDLFPRVGADYDYMHRERMRGWDSVYHEIRHDMEADIVEVLMKEHFVIEKGEREKLVLYDENESMGLMKAIDELELGRTTTEQFRSFKEKAKSWKANRVEVTGYKAADGA